MNNHYTLIGVPFDLGGRVSGSRHAPDTLRDLGLISSLRNTIDNLTDIGDIQFNTAEKLDLEDQQVKHLQAVINCNQAIIACRRNIPKENIPIIIGGDHSLGLGSVLSTMEQSSKLGLIWYDAHGDMNTESTSTTHNAHGMPVAGLMGLLKSPMQQLSDLRLDPQHIFWIGTRALDKGENNLVHNQHLHVFTAQYIKEHGMNKVMDSINDIIQKEALEHIHLSFDIDAMDPNIVAATGVPEENGLNQADLTQFIDAIHNMAAPISCLDFVEYNPILDDVDYSTGKWCIKTITDLVNAIDKQH